MNRPRLITRQRAKWAALLTCTALALTFIASRWIFIEANVIRPRAHGIIILDQGRLAASILTASSPTTSRRDIRFNAGMNNRPGLYLWFDWERADLGGTAGLKRLGVSVPLWLPLLLLLAPTCWLWRADRQPKPWQCRTCRYDLRGLEGGGGMVCPECGTKEGER
jgi:hypothetical protein